MLTTPNSHLTVSIERKDIKYGYIQSNIVLICSSINTMRSDIELNKFDLDNSGGFHYGIPIYFKKIKDQNVEWPLLEYNWPTNYDEKNFPLENKIDNNYNNLLFIDLNWIKNNSLFYIKSKLDLIIK